MSKRTLGRAGWFLALTCLVQGVTMSVARAQGQGTAGWADQVLALVNQQRAAAGLNPLTMNAELSDAAQKYSQYMATAGFFAHDAPDGSTPKTRQEAAGYTNAVVWGENIAAGQPDPQSVMTAWMNSPGHRANILFRGFTEIGIGVYQAPGSQYGIYWTQEFGARPEGAGVPATTLQPPPTVPSLAAITPAQGAPGDVVTLTGSRFGTAAGSVSFAGVQATLLSWSDTQIQVRVPAGASSGSVYVMASNGLSNGLGFTVTAAVTSPAPTTPSPTVPDATGTGASAGSAPFTPLAPTSPAPVVSFYYPASVRVGSRVTLYGRSFGQTPGTVQLNGVTLPVAYWYDTIIGVTIPAGATTGTLQVQTAGGTATAGVLTVLDLPTAPAAPPSPVALPPSNGTGTGASAPAPTTPSSNPPVVTPTVTPLTPVGSTTLQRPEIDSVSVSGSTGSEIMTFYGNNFGETAGVVRFGGYALHVMSWSNTSVSVQVPFYWHGRVRAVLERPDRQYSNMVRVRF